MERLSRSFRPEISVAAGPDARLDGCGHRHLLSTQLQMGSFTMSRLEIVGIARLPNTKDSIRLS